MSKASRTLCQFIKLVNSGPIKEKTRLACPKCDGRGELEHRHRKQHCFGPLTEKDIATRGNRPLRAYDAFYGKLVCKNTVDECDYCNCVGTVSVDRLKKIKAYSEVLSLAKDNKRISADTKIALLCKDCRGMGQVRHKHFCEACNDGKCPEFEKCYECRGVGKKLVKISELKIKYS